jgi:hypothetical protein
MHRTSIPGIHDTPDPRKQTGYLQLQGLRWARVVSNVRRGRYVVFVKRAAGIWGSTGGSTTQASPALMTRLTPVNKGKPAIAGFQMGDTGLKPTRRRQSV